MNAPVNLYAIRNVMGCCHLLVEDDVAGAPCSSTRASSGRPAPAAAAPAAAGPPAHRHPRHPAHPRPPRPRRQPRLELHDWTGAPVWAHEGGARPRRGDVIPYTGLARVCGWAEAAGRSVLRRPTGRVDRTFADGDLLPFWGGLRVVHLPGHTRGHCGFYSARHDLLFSGDLFASYCFGCAPTGPRPSSTACRTGSPPASAASPTSTRAGSCPTTTTGWTARACGGDSTGCTPGWRLARGGDPFPSRVFFCNLCVSVRCQAGGSRPCFLP